MLPLTFLSYRPPLFLFSPISFVSSLFLWIFHSLFHAFLSSLFISFFPFYSVSVAGFCVVSFAFPPPFFFLSLLPHSFLPCFLPPLPSFSVSLQLRIAFFPIFFCQQAKQVTVGSRDSQLKQLLMQFSVLENASPSSVINSN